MSRGMDDDDFEDYLVDKAKEILNEEIVESDLDKTDKPEMKNKQNKHDERVEKESTSEIPMAWDPREVEFLAENRKKMSNDELKEFMEKDSELHEEMESIDDWKGFSRWEERFLVQSFKTKKPEELAEELEREVEEVKVKMKMLGLPFSEEV